MEHIHQIIKDLGIGIMMKNVLFRKNKARWRKEKSAPKGFSIIFMILVIKKWNKNVISNALCVYPHCKVSIGQYTKMCTAPLIFFQFHSFRWQIFEEIIWLLSLSLYIWPLESWTIIAIIRFNSILRTIWGRVEC